MSTENPARINPKDLVVGGHYLHVNRLFIRQIDGLEGDTVVYHDQYGAGRCSRKAFLKVCPSLAAPEEAAQAEQQFRETVRVTEGEFTLRDEANALTAYAFRNGFLEDLHAGSPSPLLNQPGQSRISDEEMKRLMIEAADKLEQMMRVKAARFVFDRNRGDVFYEQGRRPHPVLRPDERPQVVGR